MLDASMRKRIASAANRGARLLAASGILLAPCSQGEVFKLEEASIAEVRRALDSGAISSVELTVLYLNRIFAYDVNGTRLNSVAVLNPDALNEAAEADRRLATGAAAVLTGMPYTVKDSYKVKGLTVAAGSPAFARLIANEDAFTVSRIRTAGGVLLGKTNMPPLANGGMQRGVYGRAESPYNGDYLTAAWASGSSNGSGTSTAANFAMFGMGEETVSSGRSPASNNALVAYTPSRGMLSIRGNWPLFPIRDVVVPHTRTVDDMLALLDVIMVDDPLTKGDFWRDQKVVTLPTVSSVRPKSFADLKRADALRGKRIGVPTMYIGRDTDTLNPITIRPSVLALWNQAATDLRALGATIVELDDFPVVRNWEAARAGSLDAVTRGLMPAEWVSTRLPGGQRNLEFSALNPYAYETFLQGCQDPKFPSWRVVDAAQVFPDPPGSVEANGRGLNHSYEATRNLILEGVTAPEHLPKFAEALQGLEHVRSVDFEAWMKSNNIDLVAFPANADVGRADSDVNVTSYDQGNRNGVRFSNMNHTMRYLGIPSVSVSMGTMSDTRMPVNLTFIGPAYADAELLKYGYAYEQHTRHRHAAPRTPPLPGERFHYDPRQVLPPKKRPEHNPPELTVNVQGETAAGVSVSGAVGSRGVRIELDARDDTELASLRVFVNGHEIPLQPLSTSKTAGRWQGGIGLQQLDALSSVGAATVAVLVLGKDKFGNAAARMIQVPRASVI